MRDVTEGLTQYVLICSLYCYFELQHAVGKDRRRRMWTATVVLKMKLICQLTARLRGFPPNQKSSNCDGVRRTSTLSLAIGPDRPCIVATLSA